MSEWAVRPLIRLSDPQVKQKAISHIENALNRKTPQGGAYTKSIAERDGCDWCDKDPDTVRTIEQYVKFYKELEALGIPKKTTMVGLSERAVRPLIRLSDPQVRARALSSVQKTLELPKAKDTGRFIKSVTEKEIKKIIEKAEIEIRNKRYPAPSANK